MRRAALQLMLVGWTTASNRRHLLASFQVVILKLPSWKGSWKREPQQYIRHPLDSGGGLCRYSTCSPLDDLMKQVSAYISDVSIPSEAADSLNGWRRIPWEDFDKTIELSESLSSGKDESDEECWNIVSRESLRPILCSGDRACPPPSPVEVVFVRDRLVYIKRDDLLRLAGSRVSGNKARKLFALNQIPPDQFPDCIVSHGGPQSNAMLALAAIVHSKNLELENHDTTDNNNYLATVEDVIQEELHYLLDENTVRGVPNSEENEVNGEVTILSELQLRAKQKRFVYFTKNLPKTLRTQPNGNFFRAKLLGMELVELNPKQYDDWFGSEWGGRPEPPMSPPVPGNSVWIPQGGACGLAIPGSRILALEILAFWSRHGCGRPLSVCLPGGTCTTALLLHRDLQKLQQLHVAKQQQPLMDIHVVVVPCVGDDAYARRQMMALNSQTNHSSEDIPTVLPSSPSVDEISYLGQPRRLQSNYFGFGVPHADILETFVELRDDCRLVVDLLYGAPSWTIMLRHWRATPAVRPLGSSFDPNHPLEGREIMYVHSGGLEGVGSLLLRYKHKGLVELEQIQLPGRVKGKGSIP